MKIALIHHKLAKGGGMETYLADLIHECIRLGHQVEVFTSQFSRDFDLPKTVKVHVLPNKIFPRFLRKYYFAWKLKRELAQYDFDLRISTTRAFSQDIIITGGTHKGYLKSRRRFRLSDFIECFLENKAYHSAKYVVAHSPQLQQELIELYGIKPSQIQMIYPPVNTDKFKFKAHAPHQPFRLLFASTSHKRKGGYLLLDALKLLPKDAFELWIAGRPFKEAHALKQKVRFLGYVKDMNAVFQETDLLVLPSYFEPFGLVVVQALECGTPVLVSSCAGVAPLVSAKEGLVLKEQSAQTLANLLMQAKEERFEVAPNFVERNRLGLAEHVEALLKLPFSP